MAWSKEKTFIYMQGVKNFSPREIYDSFSIDFSGT